MRDDEPHQVCCPVTTGHQTEEGAGESAEAALGAGEAGGGEAADGSLAAEGGTGVRVGRPPPLAPRSQASELSLSQAALVTLKAERIQSVESNSLTSAEFFMTINTKGNPYLLVSRRFLRHQYNVKLNRRTQQVQEELVSLKWQPGVACAFF